MFRILPTRLLPITVALFSLATAGAGSALQLLPGDIAPAATANSQSAPAMARGDDKFLVVWSDNRSNPYGQSADYETGRDLYGIRLDADGNPLDPQPFVITAEPGAQTRPRIAWNGSNWLVVFESTVAGPTGYYAQSLAAVRVSPAGVVLDRTIALPGMVPTGYEAVLASDGTNWVVVNQGSPTGADIVGMRIAPTGAILDPGTRLLVPATYYLRSGFRLAQADGVFLLTFDDRYENGTYTTGAVRFDASLSLLDSTIVPLLSVPIADLASSGDGFYVVWNRQMPDYSMVVSGTRVNTAGQKLDGDGANISGAHPLPAYGTITVSWDGLHWRAAWGYEGNVRAARVHASGVVLDPGGVALRGLQMGDNAGTGGGGLQFVWTVNTNWQDDVQSASVTAADGVGPVRLLSTSAPQQCQPDLARGAAGDLVVYRSATGTGHRILAQAFDAAGAPLTDEPVELDAGTSPSGPGFPNVAWNGSVFLVTWARPTGVVAQRFGADGAPVDAAPFAVTSAGYFGPCDVAAVGDLFLVTARRYGYTPEYIDAYAVRVRGADAAVLDPVPRLIATGYVSAAPAVCAFAGRWLVGWHSNWSHDESAASMGCSLVTTDGAVTSGGLGTFSTAGGNGIFEIGAAAGPDVALVVQSQELTSGVETDLLGYLLAPDGSILRSVNLTPWVGNQYRPRVAWDGVQFVVVFQDSRNRSFYLDQVDARGDIFGLRVMADGSVVDPRGFVISAGPAGETDPAIAGGAGSARVAAALLLNDGTHNAYRVASSVLDAAWNQWPVAVAQAAPAGGDVPVTVSFSAAGSYDPDGTVVSYVWDFGDGSSSLITFETGPVMHTYIAAGTHVATLTVTDDAGESSTQTVLVPVTLPNVPPVAVASADRTSGPAPLDVVFSASGSYDPDGALGNMEWHYGDGSYTYGTTGYHTYDTPGTYQARLVVYDSRGAAGTASVAVVVGPAVVKELRCAAIELAARTRRGGVSVSARATIRDQQGVAVPGALVAVSWKRPGASDLSQWGETDAGGVAAFATTGSHGTYTLTVTGVTKTGYTFDRAGSVLTKSVRR